MFHVASLARTAMGKGRLFLSVNIITHTLLKVVPPGFKAFAKSGPLLSATLDYRDAIHDAICPHLKSLGVPNRGKKI